MVMGKKKCDRQYARVGKSPLHVVEQWFYLGATVATVAYLCYCVYRDSLNYEPGETTRCEPTQGELVTGANRSAGRTEYDGILNFHDFGSGWRLIGRDQDISNFEWHFWYGMFWRICPWYVGHFALAKLLEWNNAIQWRKYAFLVYSVVVVCRLIGWMPVCLLTGHTIVMYLVSWTRLIPLIWTTSLLLLSTLNFEPFISTMRAMVEQDEEDTGYYFLAFALALANMRTTSFCLEKCWHDKSQPASLTEDSGQQAPVDQQMPPLTDARPSDDRLSSHTDATSQALMFGFTDLMFYLFYLPLFFTGPILTYDLFKSQMNAPLPQTTVSRHIPHALNIVRFIFWAFFNEFLLHFLYFNSLQQNLTVLNSVSLFTLSGIGYCHGQFFMTKYTVMFGLPASVARLDNLDPPDAPKCIAYIYLYSDMWKYFDRGLYSFLKRYIYVPCGGSRLGVHRQILGAVLCFMYIFYWHGAEDYIFVWILLNFVEISIEKLGSVITETALVKHIEADVLSPAMVQRIHAICAIPLFFLSCISTFCFFGGQHVGYIFFQRFILQGWLGSWLTMAALFYCALQNAMETNRWLARRHKHKQR